ncbi:hypothetical protein IWQ55_000311 [Labrenzia sp. EL_208]|nr:hypothetical protein [Labrenzia sp. EL_132]MBG6227119.1 hypothetical protein [Labrenzia sp. EL_208]
MPVYAEIDGQRYEFPDGTTPDEMRQALQSVAAPPTPPTSQPSGGPQVPLAGMEDVLSQAQYDEYQQSGFPRPNAPAQSEPQGDADLMSVLTAGAQGGQRGVANVAGLPVDLMNSAFGMAGLGSETPFLGSQSLFDLFQSPSDAIYGRDQRFAPDTASERFASRIGEEVGAASVMLAAPVARVAGMGREAAVRTARAAPAANPVQGAVNSAAESLAVAPARVGSRELALAAGAGTGAQAAQEVFGEGPLSDIAGSIGGAVATSAGGGVIRSLADLFQTIFTSSDDAVKQAVASTLISQSDTLGPRATAGQTVDAQPLINALSGDVPAEQAIPGARASTADAAGDEGLRALEYSRSSGPNAARFNAGRAQNSGAVEDILSEVAPQEPAASFTDALSTQRDGIVDDATDAGLRAEQNAERLFDNLRPAVSQETRGSSLRSALQESLDDARAEEFKAWQRVGGEVDTSGLSEAFSGVRDGLDPVRAEKFDPLAIPGVSQIVKEAGDEAGAVGPVPFEAVASIRSAMTTELRKARSSSAEFADRQRADVIGKYVDALDQYIEGNVSGDVEAYKEARRVSRDLNDRFTRTSTDPVAQALDKRGDNYARPDSSVPDLFVNDDRGRVESTRRLLSEAGDKPGVNDSIEDQLRDQVTRGGHSASAIENRVNRFSETFELFPETRDEAIEAAAGRKAADDAGDELKTILRDLGENGRGTVAKYLAHGDAQAKKAMEGVVKAKDPAKAMDELLSFVDNEPKAVEGARRAYWELMESKGKGFSAGSGTGNEAVWQSRRWNAFLGESDAVLQRLYQDNPEHLDNLKEIAGALDQLDTARTARAPNTSGTAQSLIGDNVNSNLSVASLQSRYVDVARGRMSPTYFILNTATQAVRSLKAGRRQDAYGRLLDDALIDREKAASLLKMYNPADVAATERQLHPLWGNRASEIAQGMNEAWKELQSDEQSDDS